MIAEIIKLPELSEEYKKEVLPPPTI